MLHFTLIARQSDALALAADTETSATDSNVEKNKVTAKNLLRRIASTAQRNPGAYPPLMTVEATSSHYHILCDGGVMFLTMCDPGTPTALAFAFLDDVAREFMNQYSTQIANVTRPYPFIKFDLYLQKTKKVFSSSHARGASLQLPTNRSAPVKKSYKEVMGIAETPKAGGGGGGGGASGAGGGGGMMQDKETRIALMVAGGGVAVVFVIGLFLWLIL